MALSKVHYGDTFESLTIQDYTGSPNSLTIELIPGTFSAPLKDAIDKNEVMYSTSSGKDRWAVVLQGRRSGQQVTFQHWSYDLKNDTDKGPVSLFRALLANSVSGTGHSAETYTGQLTGGTGTLQCKAVRVQTNNAGVATTTTYPIVITDYAEGTADNAKANTVTALLVGAITTA